MSEENANQGSPTEDVQPPEGAEEDISREKQRKNYNASSALRVVVPVSLCMILVTVYVQLTMTMHAPGKKTPKSLYSLVDEADAEETGGKVWRALVMAGIIIAWIALMTTVIVVLYKCRCYKVLVGFLGFSVLLVVSFVVFLAASRLIFFYRLPVSTPLVFFCIFNWSVAAMLAVFWKAPLLYQQMVLIVSSASSSTLFLYLLPDWTGWVLLAFLALWDLFAVLAPFGPLRQLVETAQERNDHENVMAALVYSSGMMFEEERLLSGRDSLTARGDEGSDREEERAEKERIEKKKREGRDGEEGEDTGDVRQNGAGTKSPQKTASREKLVAKEEEGVVEKDVDDVKEGNVKLGLGDFIFYSVLVGKATASGDPFTVLACFVAILVGLVLTLALLVLAQRALPALPTSILFGLVFFFSTKFAISPMVNDVTSHQFLL